MRILTLSLILCIAAPLPAAEPLHPVLMTRAQIATALTDRV